MIINGNCFLHAPLEFIMFHFLSLKLRHLLRFKERYEHAILRGNDKNASEREKSIGSRVAKVLFLFALPD